jgi:hypothetical protein
MANTVATGYYAICFPNPIGTSGSTKIISAINTGNLNPNSALLPQSCLGISLTTTVASATPYPSTFVAFYRASAAPTASGTTA